jgi:hypothetical protein
MPILLNCSCGKKLRIPDANAGKKVRCPGCQRILTAAQEIQAAVVDDLEVVPEPPVLQDAVQEAPLRPPPLRPPPLPVEPDSAAPKRRRRAHVEVVKLAPVKGDDDEVWRLEMAEEEILLIDGDGDVAKSIAPEQANQLIHFPSFWQSVKYLQFMDTAGAVEFQFHPDTNALTKIRSYLEYLLRRDPAARRNYKRTALGVLSAGVLAICGGATAIVISILSERFRQGRGLVYGIVGTAIGLATLLGGFGMYRKAARLERQAAEEDD